MNTPVLLIFFNRPETFRKVFDVIKKIKPSTLYLAQDGPRESNLNDIKNILECRKIANEIDWECCVYQNYSPQNLGCGVRPYSAISWAFETAEKLIILEDDCVADVSFFRYCDELLAKYENDCRISYITGLNHFEQWDFGSASYGFTKGGAIWGWATWKRAWKLYDYSVEGILDPYTERLLKNQEPLAADKIEIWKKIREKVLNGEKLSYWDIQWGFVKYSQNQLVITPKNNLICNIGVGESSTHALHHNVKHKRYLDYNNMPFFPMDFPLKHPKCIIQNLAYDSFLIKCNKRQNYNNIINAIKKRIRGLFQ